MAALGSCSHCFHPASTDSGGRTTTFSGLWFDDSTVTRRIRYQPPYREIFYDSDGSLTWVKERGDLQEPGSWAVPEWTHLK
jgi:hypothetical protein